MAHQFWFSFAPPNLASRSSSQQPTPPAEEETKERRELEAAAREKRALQAQTHAQLQHQVLKRQTSLDSKRRQTAAVTKRKFSMAAQPASSPFFQGGGGSAFQTTRYTQLPQNAQISEEESFGDEEDEGDSLECGVASGDFRPSLESLTTPSESKITQYGSCKSSSNPSDASYRSLQDVAFGVRYLNLGKSGLRVSNIAFGTWSTFSNSVMSDEAEAIIVAAYEAGINLFDLSEAHSGERCEMELGKILKRKKWRRSSYIIMTKIFWHNNAETMGLSRKHIMDSIQASLKRLQLDYIDIIMIHRVDPMCPLEEMVRAIHHVIDMGWVMYWGTSKWTPLEIMDAYTMCRQFKCFTPIVAQSEYHMFCRRDVELYMMELYNKIGIGLMVWSPLSMGLIANDLPYLKNKCFSFSWLDDETRSDSNKILAIYGESVHSKESHARLQKLHIISEIAASLDCSLTQFCMAWCLRNEAVQCLLLGATSVRQFYHALNILKLASKLSDDIMAEIERTLENKPQRPPVISSLALR